MSILQRTPEAPDPDGQAKRKPAQGVLDALADAETLRRMVRSLHRGFAYHNTDVGRAEQSDADFMRRGCPGIYVGGTWSEQAARAAFRAVPGLRA